MYYCWFCVVLRHACHSYGDVIQCNANLPRYARDLVHLKDIGKGTWKLCNNNNK